MFIFLFLGFLLEGWVLVRIASATSFLFTLLLCVFTFFVGVSLLRTASARVQHEAQRSMASEGSVARVLAPIFAQIIAGILLLMPGVISDVFGALIMLPPLHGFAQDRIRASKFAQGGQFQSIRFGSFFSGMQGQGPPPGAGPRVSQDPYDSDPSTRFRDADAPPPEDDYVPPQSRNPDGVILDGEIVDD